MKYRVDIVKKADEDQSFSDRLGKANNGMMLGFKEFMFAGITPDSDPYLVKLGKRKAEFLTPSDDLNTSTTERDSHAIERDSQTTERDSHAIERCSQATSRDFQATKQPSTNSPSGGGCLRLRAS